MVEEIGIVSETEQEEQEKRRIGELERAGWPGPLVLATCGDVEFEFSFGLRLKDGMEIAFERADKDVSSTTDWVVLSGWSHGDVKAAPGDLAIRVSEIVSAWSY